MLEKYKLMLSLQPDGKFPDCKEPFHSPSAVIDYCKAVLDIDRLAEEHLYVFGMNAKLNPIALFEVSHGTTCASPFEAKGIFARLILSGASGFICVHNHPSGDASPSRDDLMTRQKLEDAGKLLDLPIIDFVIIGRNNSYSYKSEKLKEKKNEE